MLFFEVKYYPRGRQSLLSIPSKKSYTDCLFELENVWISLFGVQGMTCITFSADRIQSRWSIAFCHEVKSSNNERIGIYIQTPTFLFTY
ncbi:hypothetical protein I7I53_00652 [Histoplasma capsulatum var. duboisii H88]|uniref:Uncharacterized protein n=1 Tax=Ajellomyces capsulatus (strain H88) TaxID=544711 RepID=A0A8A1LH70_AJEC8|nr:hypothetical protein I7I53_00652 [Histoplasma capsulatum var. duboisii H88]